MSVPGRVYWNRNKPSTISSQWDAVDESGASYIDVMVDISPNSLEDLRVGMIFSCVVDCADGNALLPGRQLFLIDSEGSTPDEAAGSILITP